MHKLNFNANEKVFGSNHVKGGFTLVEVMIALGILSIIGLGVTQLILAQFKMVRTIAQRQEIVSFTNLIVQQFSKPTVCGWQMLGRKIVANPIPTQAAPSSTKLVFTELRQGENATSAILAKVGENLPGSSLGLLVNSISFSEIYASSVPAGGNANDYVGMLEIGFTSNEQANRPVRFPITFQTLASDPMADKTIVKCAGTSSSAGPNLRYFTSNDNFVVPDGVTKIAVEVWGAGGGGGGSANNNAGIGGGGGGGGYAYRVCDVFPGQTIPVVVGVGGAGGTPFTNGTSGTNSNFGGCVGATGGGAGNFGVTWNGGAGGSGWYGALNLNGTKGGSSISVSGGLFAGTGGSSPNGGGGGGWESAGAVPGGGGGGGEQDSYVGGAGGNGLVKLTW